MLARLQRTSTLFLLTSTLLWLTGCWWFGAPAWLYAAALIIAFGHAFVLALEFAILGAVHGDDPAPKASAFALAKAWFTEVRMAVQVFNWRQPFRSHLLPDTIDNGLSPLQRTPVVLVHGLICNRGFWLPLLAALRARSIPYIAVNLEPVFAASIHEYVPILEAAVRRATDAAGKPPLIVAHSMGGLVVRAWLATDRDLNGSRVRRIITIGSPHQGTWLAKLGRTTLARQMRRGSPWLRGLQGVEAQGLAVGTSTAYERFTCFYSDCDNIVMPCSTAALPGADNRLLRGAAHIELAFRPEVFDEVLRCAFDPCVKR